MPDDIIQAVDQGNKVTVLVSTDFIKAFDTIDRDILLPVLQHISVADKCIKSFENYLTRTGFYLGAF